VLAYLQRLSGYSRAQVTRRVKSYQTPGHVAARRDTGTDMVLLAEVDRALGRLSGLVTAFFGFRLGTTWPAPDKRRICRRISAR